MTDMNAKASDDAVRVALTIVQRFAPGAAQEWKEHAAQEIAVVIERERQRAAEELAALVEAQRIGGERRDATGDEGLR